jgi:hypothetical protein
LIQRGAFTAPLSPLSGEHFLQIVRQVEALFEALGVGDATWRTRLPKHPLREFALHS